MEAWSGKSASYALAAMGAVATLVGLALVESGGRAGNAARDGILVGGDIILLAGEVLVLGGAALFFTAIYAYVHATRKRPEEPRSF